GGARRRRSRQGPAARRQDRQGLTPFFLRRSFVTQSSRRGPVPRHVAIIMDGNGRWATRRGLARAQGHEAGMHAVRRTAEAAVDAGVEVLTLFAFSSANWKRPAGEVSNLMRLFKVYLRADLQRLKESGVRLSIIGRRDR